MFMVQDSGLRISCVRQLTGINPSEVVVWAAPVTAARFNAQNHNICQGVLMV